MINDRILKIISAVLSFVLIITIFGVVFGAEKVLPRKNEEEISKFVPKVIYSANGENKLPNQSEKTEEQEDEEQDEETPPDEQKNENQDVKKETSVLNNPMKEAGEKESGEGGEGEFGNEEGEGDPSVVTDLENKIVTPADLDNEVFTFFAYIVDGNENHSLSVNFHNSETSFSGVNLENDSDFYSHKLVLGANYITLFLYKDNELLSSIDYIITYQADKASAENPESGENPPTIETNLDGFSGTIENEEFTFTVKARTYTGDVIYSDHIEVTLDGETLVNPTGSTIFEYVLYLFSQDEYSDHYLTVTAWDDEGNSAFVDYVINYHQLEEGSSAGTVTVVLDATTVGYGILGAIDYDLTAGENAAEVLVNAIADMGYSALYNGSTDIGFYLSGVAGLAGVGEVPPELWELIEKDGLTITSPADGDSLGERDYTSGSGWMYSINGEIYPGKGFSEYKLSDGDVLYIRFTIAYGKDIGGSSESYGNLSGYCGAWIDGGFVEYGHDYIEVEMVDATATEDGYIRYECSQCKSEYTETIPATEEEHEHVYEEVDRMEATPEYEGYVGYLCECGDYYEEILYYNDEEEEEAIE